MDERPTKGWTPGDYFDESVNWLFTGLVLPLSPIVVAAIFLVLNGTAVTLTLLFRGGVLLIYATTIAANTVALSRQIDRERPKLASTLCLWPAVMILIAGGCVYGPVLMIELLSTGIQLASFFIDKNLILFSALLAGSAAIHNLFFTLLVRSQ